MILYMIESKNEHVEKKKKTTTKVHVCMDIDVINSNNIFNIQGL